MSYDHGGVNDDQNQFGNQQNHHSETPVINACKMVAVRLAVFFAGMMAGGVMINVHRQVAVWRLFLFGAIAFLLIVRGFCICYLLAIISSNTANANREKQKNDCEQKKIFGIHMLVFCTQIFPWNKADIKSGNAYNLS